MEDILEGPTQLGKFITAIIKESRSRRGLGFGQGVEFMFKKL